MKCQLCDKKDFPIIYNIDYPIEKQPVIICRECSREHLDYMSWNRIWIYDQMQKGKRCS
jgi:hypothetical protein